MNRQDSLRPVTRRALRIRYHSPATCFLPGDAYSGTSSDDTSSLIDFVPTTRLAGPVLTVSNYTDTQLRLSWTPITDAVYYQIFRSTSPDGPFEFLFGPVAELFYLDTPPAAGMYYYQVTAIEPNAGQTEPSNVGSGEITEVEPGIELPPIPGYVLWFAPESEAASDTGGTTLVEDEDSEVQFWQDLSGFENHATFPGGNAGLQGPLLKTGVLNGLRGLRFGETSGAVQIRTGLVTGANVDLSGGMTVFCVGGFRQAPSFVEPGAVFVAHGTQVYLRAHPIFTDQFESFHTASSVQLTSPVSRGFTDYLMTLQFDEAANEFLLRVDGAAVDSQTDTGATPSSAQVGIGHRPDDGVNSHLNGQIYEILVYPTRLSNTDRAAVENFLMEKYAL